jgi:UDP-N-acetylmuramate dehydrogenase
VRTAIKQVLENEPLARYTSWRIGGPARVLAVAAGQQELRDALAWARERGMRVALLGGGTNTLVDDAGFDGLVIRYREAQLRVTEQGEQALAHVTAGSPMAGTARRLAHQGWAGLEWAEGLPGTVGGAVYGNAGCYGGDVAGALMRAWLLVDDQVEEWPLERMQYGYRTSALKQSAREGFEAQRPLIVAAELRLQRADPRELEAQMERTAALRRSKTPAGQSCGSVFKNPPGDSAGRLIEAAGLKGARSGAAEGSHKHANYIVNLGGATSADVLRLVELVRERVLAEFGIALEREVQVLR